MPPLCRGRKKNRGYDPRRVKRGIGREEEEEGGGGGGREGGGREGWGMTTGCVGEWTPHQAICKVAPLAAPSLSFPISKHNNPLISWKCHNQSLGRTPELMSITVLTNLVMSAGSYDKRDPALPFLQCSQMVWGTWRSMTFHRKVQPRVSDVFVHVLCAWDFFRVIVFLTMSKFKILVLWQDSFAAGQAGQNITVEDVKSWCLLVVHLSHCLYEGPET